MRIRCFPNADPRALAAFRELDDRLYPQRVNPPSPPPPASATLFCVMDGDRVAAHAAALVNPLIPAGLLGWFESDDRLEAASMLFDAVQTHFAGRGIPSMIGPINGSTWAAYRVALPEGTPFFLDVESMPYYARFFEDNGFETIASYHSTRGDLSERAFPRLERMTPVIQGRGVTISEFEPDRAETILREIHELSLDSFKHNFLYTPVPVEFFLQKYLPLLVKVPPQCILLARDGAGRLIGYLFAIPNLLCSDRRELVIKTLAVRPEPVCRGLGAFLVELCSRRACESGVQAVYHALMHDANQSANIGRDDMTVCRRYRLYRRTRP